MTRSFRRWVFPLTATALFACSGDNFAPPVSSGGGGSAGTNGAKAGASGVGGAAGVASGAGAGGGGAGLAGAGASAGYGTAGSGVSSGSAGSGSARGGEGGASAGSGATAGASGSSAGGGGASSGNAGTSSGGTTGMAGTTSGMAGTSAGGSEGTAGASAGGGGGESDGGSGGGGNGGSAGTDAVGGGAGNGGAGGCTKNADCPISSEACGLAICAEGVCTLSANPSGFAPQVAGNCRREICDVSLPAVTTEIDLSDLPKNRGDCEVPVCLASAPAYREDPLLCAGSASCVAGTCKGSCAACPAGLATTIGPKGLGVCWLPKAESKGDSTVAVSLAPETVGFEPDKACDHDVATYWNAGGPGTEDTPVSISLSFPARRVSVVYVSVTVNPAPNTVVSSIRYELDVFGTNGLKAKNVARQLVSGPATNAIVAFPLGSSLEVISLAVAASSDNSWVTVNEVYYRDCD